MEKRAIFSNMIKVKLVTKKTAKNIRLINSSLNKNTIVPKARVTKKDDFVTLHTISRSFLVRKERYIPFK